jgi:single-stranded DNA-binding protein
MLYPLSFTGRLGSDIQVKTNKNGKSYANFSVACENGKKGDDFYELVWVPFSINGRLAENAAKSLKKGMVVEVMAKVSSYEKDVVIDGEEKSLSLITFRATSIAPSLAFATVTVEKNPFDDDNAGSGQRRESRQESREERTESKSAPKKETVKASAGAGDFDDF